MDVKPSIVISACLLGQPVRFNGGHCQDSFVLSLSPYVNWVPICPEMEMGLGAPRETLRLIEQSDLALVGAKSGKNYAGAALAVAQDRVQAWQGLDIHGFLLKKKSPSCGPERVPVYRDNGYRARSTSGLVAGAFRAAYPDYPIEDEGRLLDSGIREHFLIRVYTLARWSHVQKQPTLKAIMDFHRDHKMLFLAHDERTYREMGRLIASGRLDAHDRSQYKQMLLQCLSKQPTRGSHANVIQHLAGFLKRDVPSEWRRELANLIDQYRQKRQPRQAVMTLIRHYFRQHPHAWVKNQVYFQPFPELDSSLNFV
ncbi:MAG: DUF1722 domain-containing protein [Acidobacteria bacterium]|nr:DUF1722 domain-containing protein [Acidobacteriota bacterium]MCB9397034.1 DUF1722 domain-containing protein [Acidobacteriota bacterium]